MSLKSEHIFLREIREQPAAIRDTLNGDRDEVSMAANFLEGKRLHLLGMGSSYFSSLYAKYLFQELMQRSTENYIASEFIHYPIPPTSNDVFVAISQSGESVETVKSAEYLRRRHALVLGITNNPESKLARLSNRVLFTRAGEERCSSTKTFTTTLALLYDLVSTLAVQAKKANRGSRERLLNHLMATTLTLERRFAEWEEASRLWAGKLANSRAATVIGRGPNLVAALQAALLLKEVVKLPAEGMSGGEFSHGPIEAISDKFSVIVLGGGSTWRLQIKLAKRAKSLGAQVLMLAPHEVRNMDSIGFGRIDGPLMIFPLMILLNLLTYYTATRIGLNPDKFNVLSKITRRE